MFHIPEKPKAVKLVRAALCETARAREWQKAAVAFFRHLREHGVNAPEALSPTVGFGKHRGQTVEWIVNNDPAYSTWAIANFRHTYPALHKEFRREMKARYK
jgi:hypothetical protein